MTTVKELKEYLNNLDENETLYVKTWNFEEGIDSILTEHDVIDEANNILTEHDVIDEDTENEITNIDDALYYLADMNCDYQYVKFSIRRRN